MGSTTRAQIVTVRPAFRQGGFMEHDGVTGTRYVIRESSDDYLVDVRPDGIGQAWVSKTRCEPCATCGPHHYGEPGTCALDIQPGGWCLACDGPVSDAYDRFCSSACDIAYQKAQDPEDERWATGS